MRDCCNTDALGLLWPKILRDDFQQLCTNNSAKSPSVKDNYLQICNQTAFAFKVFISSIESGQKITENVGCLKKRFQSDNQTQKKQ